MHKKCWLALTLVAASSSALAAGPMLRSGTVYVVEADSRDASGSGELSLRPANDRGEPEGDAAAVKVRVNLCDGAIGRLARFENGGAQGSLRTYGATGPEGAGTSPRTFIDSAGMAGQPKGSCRIAG